MHANGSTRSLYKLIQRLPIFSGIGRAFPPFHSPGPQTASPRGHARPCESPHQRPPGRRATQPGRDPAHRQRTTGGASLGPEARDVARSLGCQARLAYGSQDRQAGDSLSREVSVRSVTLWCDLLLFSYNF